MSAHETTGAGYWNAVLLAATAPPESPTSADEVRGAGLAEVNDMAPTPERADLRCHQPYTFTFPDQVSHLPVPKLRRFVSVSQHGPAAGSFLVSTSRLNREVRDGSFAEPRRTLVGS